MGGFVVLMLVRMWSWGFELYLYDHDVFVSCINGLLHNGCLGSLIMGDLCGRLWFCGVFGCLNMGVSL